MKILIIDDEKDIVAFLKRGLKAKAYVVDTAYDGEEGSYLALSGHYDLIVLDNNLPKMEGVQVLKNIRHAGITTPILALTVNTTLKQKGEMFQEGADDYLTKPFLFDEFIWRAEALLRRPKIIRDKVLKMGKLHLDTRNQVALRKGRKIYLTGKEYALLELFFHRRDEILSRSQIMDQVWENNADPFSNTIEAHVMSLRKKINLPEEIDYIHTFAGRGYKFSLSRL
ncbi:MAG: response regulator transcription factor [Patescibacteria group bacterium]|nr:response regulator transcription factor [Patescibacteria group bacterium]